MFIAQMIHAKKIVVYKPKSFTNRFLPCIVDAIGCLAQMFDVRSHYVPKQYTQYSTTNYLFVFFAERLFFESPSLSQRQCLSFARRPSMKLLLRLLSCRSTFLRSREASRAVIMSLWAFSPLPFSLRACLHSYILPYRDRRKQPPCPRSKVRI